jgi:electron transport complex protein RnfC
MRVTRGELIADAPGYVGMRIHAPTSGTITAIGEFPVVHPSGLPAAAIVLTPDGLDEAGAGVAAVDPASVSATEIFERIAAAGIVGLGGAGFPAHVKVQEGETQQVDTLIVNAVECEPYICCDDRVAREAPAEIVGGAALLARAMNARECVIAVEDDMPEAHALLAQAAGDAITVVSVPAVYPAGGEKQLITVLTGKEVPSGLLPIHVGVAVLNVQTVRAIYHAVTAGTPLIERMVTVAGDIAEAGNFNVLTGTPVRHVLQHTGAMPLGRRFVVSGGPMMGTRVGNIEAPVTKTVNCLLVRDEPAEAPAPLPCIRCGDCVPVCPVGLNPQQLFESVRTADFDTAQDYHLFDCIDCGCCAYVCPSRIPLVQHYRHAKSAIEALDRDRLEADNARASYTARSRRMAARDIDTADPVVALADLESLDDDRIKRELDAVLSRTRTKRSPENEA